MKSKTLSKIIFLAIIFLSFVLMPFNKADAKGKKYNRNIASTKSNLANKKSAISKKKKSKLTKLTKKKNHNVTAKSKKKNHAVNGKSKKKSHVATAKSKKYHSKVDSRYVAAKVIVPELEIVMPDGDFHADYDASAVDTDTTTQPSADEFQNY